MLVCLEKPPTPPPEAPVAVVDDVFGLRRPELPRFNGRLPLDPLLSDEIVGVF